MLYFPVPETFCGRTAHLGITGSIAAYKALDLLRLLGRTGVRAGATLTRAGQRFVTPESLTALGAEKVYTDLFTADPSHPYPHLEPGQSAQVLAVAPATANILAKAVHGLADDLLSCQILAFRGPVLLAPAMNPAMWEARATRRNWAMAQELGFVCIEPDQGLVACKDSGRGRLPAVEVVAAHILRALGPNDLKGRKVLVTWGPTREHWDRVRFLGNPSTGRMGMSIALAAWLRGATVTGISGPTQETLPPLFPVRQIENAAEMRQACQELWPTQDIACMTAAVADFAPVPRAEVKVKKRTLSEGAVSIQCLPTTDILQEMGQGKQPGQVLIGFAAEAEELEQEGPRKLADKNLDMLLANPIDVPGAGFGSETNIMRVWTRSGRTESWPRLPKPEVAWRLWDFLPCL